MALIITAAERLAIPPKINIAMFAKSGVGKTTQARTLPAEKTLFIDLEAGMLAVAGWGGDSIDVRKMAVQVGMHPWELCRALACVIGGPNPSHKGLGMPFSPEMYECYVKVIGGPQQFDKYENVFVDSITVSGRHSFNFSCTMPEAFSEKTGKPDKRGAYGLHGQEMISWLTHLQHCPKSIIVTGIVDEKKDDLGRITWDAQIEGQKTGTELPGIFDEVVTLAILKQEAGPDYRAFVCHQQNPWGMPAKDRSGCLTMIEEPNLWKLIEKIRAGKRLDATLDLEIPKPILAEEAMAMVKS